MDNEEYISWLEQKYAVLLNHVMTYQIDWEKMANDPDYTPEYDTLTVKAMDVMNMIDDRKEAK